MHCKPDTPFCKVKMLKSLLFMLDNLLFMVYSMKCKNHIERGTAKMKNRLRVIRAEKTLTQQRLADMCEISRHTLMCIEHEKSIPNGDTMLRLSKALKTPIEEIFLDFSL